MQGWGPTHLLTVDQLNRRITCLFLLATGQQFKALGLMKHRDFSWGAGRCTLRYTSKMKSNDPGRNPLILNFEEFGVNELCVYSYLKEYMGREELKGAGEAVFATTRSPHVAAAQETLTRYVRCTMAEAGIDMGIFTPNSCHHAFTSAAARTPVPLATIIMAAGWTSETTFRRFYNRPLSTRGTTTTNLIPNIWGESGDNA